MDLKTFIKTSVQEIIAGINDSHNEIQSKYGPTQGLIILQPGRAHEPNSHIETIEIEVIVSVESEDKAGVAGGIKIVTANTSTSNKSGQQNKLKFSIPISFSKA